MNRINLKSEDRGQSRKSKNKWRQYKIEGQDKFWKKNDSSRLQKPGKKNELSSKGISISTGFQVRELGSMYLPNFQINGEIDSQQKGLLNIYK